MTDQGVNKLAKTAKKLVTLDLLGCMRISNKSVSKLAKHCTALVNLRLNDCNKLRDESIQAVLNNRSAELERLSLSRCSKLRHCFKKVADCPRLVSLSIYDCQNVEVEHLQALLKRCPQLTQLKLSKYKNLSPQTVEVLATHCPKLTDLNLRSSFQKIVDDTGMIKLIKNCSHLTRLNLRAFSKLTEKTVAALARSATKLERLNLASSQTMCRKVDCLKELAANSPNLTHLNLMWWDKLEDPVFCEFARKCPLTHLNLRRCYKVTNKAVITVANCCPHLKSLNLHGCKNLSVKGFREVSNKCRQLVCLGLAYTKLFQYAEPEEVKEMERTKMADVLASFSSRLEKLCLRSATWVTNEVVKTLARAQPQLKLINLSKCFKVTDDSVQALGEHCKRLQQVDLHFCGDLGTRAADALKMHFPELVWLLLQCNQMQEKQVKAIINSCPNLTTMNLLDFETDDKNQNQAVDNLFNTYHQLQFIKLEYSRPEKSKKWLKIFGKSMKKEKRRNLIKEFSRHSKELNFRSHRKIWRIYNGYEEHKWVQ